MQGECGRDQRREIKTPIPKAPFMASRRCLNALSRGAAALISANSRPSLSSLKPIHALFIPISSETLIPTQTQLIEPSWFASWTHHCRYFSSNRSDDDEEEESSDEGEDDTTPSDLQREYSVEEKEEEAAAIGYKVVGPLKRSDRVFKPYEPVFAVVQVGSHQFKVSNRDCIYTEKLKFCEVNDKLLLNKVLLLGSGTQTIIGRPTVPDAAVHAVVEEHALDAKVLIFKKKRRKNYRRTKGHRQELTKLRITDIQGIEKPETKVDGKPFKAAIKKPEKVAVAA